MKFKVDLTAGDRPERFNAEGDYIVAIESVEQQMTPQGFEKAVIVFKDDKNRTAKDDLLNKDTVYWRLNQLIVASGMKVENGSEMDFSKRGEFFNFVKSFVGMKITITLKNDSYEKNGETKTFLKVQRYSKPSAADAPF
jgi:hypothetical protein